MKKKIKKINSLSAAKVLGALSASFGLVLSVVFVALEILYPETTGWAESMLIAVLFPLTYGLLGFACGGVGAFFYNFSSEHIGGLEIELE